MGRRIVGASFATTRVWADGSDDSDDPGASPLFSDVDSFLRNVKRVYRVTQGLGSAIQHIAPAPLSFAALQARATELALVIDGWSAKLDLCLSALAQLKAECTSTSATRMKITRLIEAHESDLLAVESAIRDEQIVIDDLSKRLQPLQSEAKSQEAQAFQLQKALAAARAELVSIGTRFSGRLESIVDRRDTFQRLAAASPILQDLLVQFDERQLREVQSIDEMWQTIQVLLNVLYAKRAIHLWVARGRNSTRTSERLRLAAQMSRLQEELRERSDINQAIKESIHGLRRKFDAILVSISERSRELLRLTEAQKSLHVEKYRLIVETTKQKQTEEELVSERQLLQSEYSQLEARRGDLKICLAATAQANEAGFPDLDSRISVAQQDIRLITVKINAYQHRRRCKLSV
jgi:chromosome segregation ATPase